LSGHRNTDIEDLKFIADAEKRLAALRRPDDPAQAAEKDRLARLDDQAWLAQMSQRLNDLKKPD
jgi:hypothetical protein